MYIDEATLSDMVIDRSVLNTYLENYTTQLPEHIAIIMDGNGRWAQRRGKKRLQGHHAGAKSVRRVVESCRYLGVKVLTLYAFSSENWNRPGDEVEGLMELFLNYMLREKERLVRYGIRLNIIGNRKRLPERVQVQMEQLENATKLLDSMTLQVAVSYGSREEIVDATRRVAQMIRDGKLTIEDINEQLFESHLYTHNLSDPDLLIRTSGEQRISNFLLWQLAYTELWFTKVYWPDFNEENLIEAIESYGARERRFGKTKEQMVENPAVDF